MEGIAQRSAHPEERQIVNQYYNEAFAGQAHGTAKASHVKSSLKSVESGLDKLPGERVLKEDRMTAGVATAVVGDSSTAYSVVLPFPPLGPTYPAGLRVGVDFPNANVGPATLDAGLGPLPIRQIDGSALTDGHIGSGSTGLLQVDAMLTHWTILAGARGIQGPAGPPDGAFSLDDDGDLVFTPTGGSAYVLGKARFHWEGDYSSSTTYEFLSIVRVGTALYVKITVAASTGVAVTDTTVWQRLAQDGADAALRYAFSTSTTMADPAAGDIRLNNAAPANVTRIAIDDQDALGNDLAGYITSWDDTGEANGHGTLFIRDRSDDDILVYRVDGLVDNSGWTRLNVTHQAGTSLPADDAALDVWFVPTGNKGADGDKGSIFVPASGVVQSGTGNAVIALTPTDAATGYAEGDAYEFVLESDITANASINVSTRGNKNFNFTSAMRLNRLKAGYVVRAVYDGTRFLLGSLIAAVMTATMVEFTASDPAYAWPYTAPKALAVIDGAGGAGGRVFGADTNIAGGDGSGNSVNGNAAPPGAGSDGGGATSITVNGSTYTAPGGGGGGGRDSQSSGAGKGGDAGVSSPQGNYLGVSLRGHGGGGDGSPGGAGEDHSVGDGGNGIRVVVVIENLSLGDVMNIQIGNGGAASGGAAGDGTDGKVTLYPLWA